MVNSMATVKSGFVSLGCPKNLVDSQNIITLLLKSGYDVSNTYENADAVVINTCGFIESSVEESMNVINEALGSCKNVVVTGCLGPRKDFILEHYPEVKAVSGPHSPEAVLRDINALFPDYHGRSCFKVPEGGVLLTPPHYAYLKISEGCSHRCSFCVIPQIRGDLESFSPEAVLKQAEAYAKRGVKELLVVAQDTSAYGMDVKYPGFRNYERGDLYALTRELGKLGLWQRVHYAYPYPHVVKLVEQMAEGLVLPYMDVPLQHVNKRILGLMKRPGSHERAPVPARRSDPRHRSPGRRHRRQLLRPPPGSQETGGHRGHRGAHPPHRQHRRRGLLLLRLRLRRHERLPQGTEEQLRLSRPLRSPPQGRFQRGAGLPHRLLEFAPLSFTIRLTNAV